MARYWRIASGISQLSPVSILFFAMSLIFARLSRTVRLHDVCWWTQRWTYLFWNQIWTERSVILMSSAILSLTVAVGVGFLLNSISRVTNWSWVARCLFWFFCCWVKVLLRGGLREAELLPAEFDAVGDGVEIILRASSCEISDILISLTRSQLFFICLITIFSPLVLCM